MFKLRFGVFFRGFAERPSSKKIASIKKAHNGITNNFHLLIIIFIKLYFADSKDLNVPISEITLPSVGEALRNVNVFVNKPDPNLMADSEYPDWIWSARGPCRAEAKNKLSNLPDMNDSPDAEMTQLKRFLRSSNRQAIRKENALNKGTNQ